MCNDAPTRRRDPGLERLEQQRYQVLEQVYLLCEGAENGGADVRRFAAEMEVAVESNRAAIEDLARLGLLSMDPVVGEVRLTPRGCEYIQRGAWRRRTVRE
jgi:Mn-dependent DtxR family transcriptional regulator